MNRNKSIAIRNLINNVTSFKTLSKKFKGSGDNDVSEAYTEIAKFVNEQIEKLRKEELSA